MADDVQQIRVEILGAAGQFREMLDGAINKLVGPGGLREAIKAIPDQLTVDALVSTGDAEGKLKELRNTIVETQALVERGSQVGLDVSDAQAKLAALRAELASMDTEWQAKLGPGIAGAAYLPGTPAQRSTILAGRPGSDTGASSVTAAGIRSQGPGSVQDPLVVAIEDGQTAGLGARAAALGTGKPSSTTEVVTTGGGGEGGGGGPRLALGFGGGGGNDGNNLRRALLWGGGGLFGIGAGFGTLGSFAGLGAEHLLTTGLGLVGSATAGAAGAGLVGMGALGEIGVGGGSDIAVSSSAIADTKQLYDALEKVNEAEERYGKNSLQAREAQQALNVTMKDTLGGTAGVTAELHLAERLSHLNTVWDQSTSNARVMFTQIAEQGVQLAEAYLPKVVQAAERNLPLINQAIRPLFSWLEGPEGMGIWDRLEQEFASQLPTAVHAFDEAMELLAKTVAAASQYTGGFTQMLDRFFTKWNSPEMFAHWSEEIGHLVDEFHVWLDLFKTFGEDIFDMFRNDAGTGKAIVETITEMLTRLREWERSTAGSAQLHTIFQVHKEEVIALLRVIPPLIESISPIYMTVAPTLVRAVTDIAEAIAWVLRGLDHLGPAMQTLIGFGLIAGKLGVLVPVLRGIGASFGFIAAQEKKVVDMTSGELADALAGQQANAAKTVEANDALAASDTRVVEGTAGADATGLAGLKGKVTAGLPLVTRGVVTAGMGAILANSAASVAGVTGTANTAVTLAGAGAGAGYVLGPALGSLLGTEIAPGVGTAIGAGIGVAAPYVVSFLEDVFSSHAADYAKSFAEHFAAPLAPMLTHQTDTVLESSLKRQREHVEEQRRQLAATEGAGVSRIGGRGGPATLSSPDVTGARKQLFNAEYREGVTAAQGLQEAFSGVTRLTSSAFLQDTIQQLRSLSGEARKAAAQAMVSFAEGLEQEGKLPKGSISRVIDGLEAEFPGLDAYFAEHAQHTASEVAEAFKLTGARQALVEGLSHLRAEWGLFNLDPTVNGKNMVHNLSLAMSDLRSIIATSTGQARDEALGHLRELQLKGTGYFDQLLTTTASKLAAWAPAVKAGTGNAAQAAEKEMSAFEGAVEGAVEAGAIAASTGAGLIGKALNAELKAFGAHAIEIPQIQVQGLVRAAAGQVKVNMGKLHATGGLVQFGRAGDAGPDTIPLRMGGQDIVVGSGEIGAVLTKDQQAFLNDRLADVGGLAGMFDKIAKPHHAALYASGGLVGANPAGGLVGEGATLHAPAVTGGGPLGALVTAGLQKAAAAANAYLAAHGGVGAAGVGGRFGAAYAPGLPGPARTRLEQIARQRGWSVQDWLGVIELESGGNPAARNPSGAYGIGQALGATQAEYPKMVSSSPVEQIEGMAEYIASRYGNPTAALEHEHAFHWYARGGVLGRALKLATGGIISRNYRKPGVIYVRAPTTRVLPPAKQPPRPPRSAPRKPSNPARPHKVNLATYEAMPADVKQAHKRQEQEAAEAAARAAAYEELLETQRLIPTQALATLTEADVAYLDPGAGPGGESLGPNNEVVESPRLHLMPGDQLVNVAGMITGRYFTFGNTITGGEWHAGIQQRKQQIGELLADLYPEEHALSAEAGISQWAVPREEKATRLARAREARVKTFLGKRVGRALKVKQELAAITTGNLKRNLAEALSRQGINVRRADLGQELSTVTSELNAERSSQAEMLPIERDASYARMLEAQREAIRAAMTNEGSLLSSLSDKKAVRSAQEALLKNTLKGQLEGLEEENHALGGSSTEVGEGGLIGRIKARLTSLVEDVPGWKQDATEAGSTIKSVARTIRELVAEQAGLDGTVPIQVRTPGATETARTQSQEELLDMVRQQLEQTQKQLEINQAQFQAFKGFAPLFAARLVGSFATGTDFVPQTGLALVHRGEQIIPDPDGPYNNRAAGVQQAAQPPDITIVMQNNEPPLMKIIEAAMNKKGLRVITDQAGQRSRLMAGVTHGRQF